MKERIGQKVLVRGSWAELSLHAGTLRTVRCI
jgi:hypothetical protein